MIPKEPYYKGMHIRRQYPQMSLLQLQRLIDLGRIDPEQPIDMTTLCNTKVIEINPGGRQYGVNLTDEGADVFKAKVSLEVQWTDEVAIAAVERNGGSIVTKFYDLQCVGAMADPLTFLHRGLPIPRCKLPPEDAIEFYSDPRCRGYLADPALVAQHRQELAQKYGYTLPDITQDPLYPMLSRRKDPRQIWFGLEPGWLVNLTDKQVLRPTDPDLTEYYRA